MRERKQLLRGESLNKMIRGGGERLKGEFSSCSNNRRYFFGICNLSLFCDTSMQRGPFYFLLFSHCQGCRYSPQLSNLIKTLYPFLPCQFSTSAMMKIAKKTPLKFVLLQRLVVVLSKISVCLSFQSGQGIQSHHK